MRSIFFNDAGLLRSGWRFATFVFAFSFSVIVLRTVTDTALGRLNLAPEPGTGVYMLINAMFSLVPALVMGWLCAKHLENLPFRSLGASFTDGWLKHLIFGVTLGAFTLTFAVAIAYALGGLRFQFNSAESSSITSSLIFSLGVFSLAAAFEEVLFRGYILQTFARADLAWLAILVTASFFGLVHMGNPSAGVISTLNTFLAGIWFGLAYLKTRDLWFVWGIHLMWNWMQASVFGIEVSGITSIATSPLLVELDHGPSWLTGESYGVEGGIVCTVALAASILVIHFYPGLRPAPEMLAMTSGNEGREARTV
jgi:uncharacterized protein